jgi:hypothetical protein
VDASPSRERINIDSNGGSFGKALVLRWSSFLDQIWLDFHEVVHHFPMGSSLASTGFLIFHRQIWIGFYEFFVDEIWIGFYESLVNEIWIGFYESFIDEI